MATTTAKKPATTKLLDSAEISAGDVFSELSHYTFEGIEGKDFRMLHHASGQRVILTGEYIEHFLSTANQWHKEVEVGKEDKYWTAKQLQEATARGDFKNATVLPNEGDVRVQGIRSVWENIYSAKVFQVCYQKQDKPLSDKKLNELRAAQIKVTIEALEKAQKNKKGIAATAQEEIKKIQENPILPYEAGEMRVLTGYKTQFISRDGKYNCVDMELPKPDNIRPVNINTIAWVIIDGVKYIVK